MNSPPAGEGNPEPDLGHTTLLAWARQRPARSARTSCWSRSAKAAWASSTWPSRREPVRRQVALKVIKPGMDTRQVIARFEAERQALALMDHPNIAKVLDAGRHRDRPALLRHGAGPRRPDHRVLRPATAHDPRAAGAVRRRSARRCSTRIRRGSSTATSSRRTSWSRSRRRAGAQGHRLRRRQGHGAAAHRADALHRASASSSARRCT